MSLINVLAMVTFVKPVVPDNPLTSKLKTLLVELNAISETVEFEIMENGEYQLVTS